ncbi:MAG: Arm DNA-binding domain-containing protein, partial [Betaproteobacteria bacterium]
MLTAIKVKSAKGKVKQYKLTDGQGLYLLVKPNGGKLWRFKYRFGGKEKLLSFGTYPEISLVEARAKRDEARKQVANG